MTYKIANKRLLTLDWIGLGDVAISLVSIRLYTYPCVLYNFDTLRGILIYFGRDEEEDQ